MASEKGIIVYVRRNKLSSLLTGKSADGGKRRDDVEVSLLNFFGQITFIYVFTSISSLSGFLYHFCPMEWCVLFLIDIFNQSSICSFTCVISVNEHSEDQSIKYPVDDLLVQPTVEDRLLTERPSPCRDFNVPMECVGDLLMVWDFCTSFGRLLNLSPFSLEDFENSLCYKDSTPILVVESCSSLLRLLVKDNSKFAMVVENRKRRPKVSYIFFL